MVESINRKVTKKTQAKPCLSANLTKSVGLLRANFRLVLLRLILTAAILKNNFSAISSLAKLLPIKPMDYFES